ncbi:Mitochondrial inner membrane protein COX18 [Gracilariopsis chorda]|uniref:Mitochondrial inner membrane protein COX18 n=1 Tax=Gracilariopsis chorda TaxID=448386 RepID=A0A2V3IUN9_9FLOR|nr:Mitochondrial inner membrane protein COX18 [Gracilariopsis chorda]|eukprot:PXF44850.1 Mitochondrial inner membrane protein COX18 [Gracilariopsis chorda]
MSLSRTSVLRRYAPLLGHSYPRILQNAHTPILSNHHSHRDLATKASVPSSLAQFSSTAADQLQALHEAVPFDLPWSVTIPLTSLAIRGLSLPLLYHNEVHRGRVRIAAKEQPRIQHFVRNTPGTLLQKYWTYRRLNRLTLRSAGTSSLRNFKWHLVVHLPLIISASLGMRELSSRADNGWSVTSLGWLSDLSAPDATAVLPLLTAGLWLWNLEPGATPSTKLHPVQKLPIHAGRFILRSFQVLSVVSVSVTTQLPSGLVLFWACNAMLTTGLRYILSNDGLRRRIGLLTAADLKEISAPPVMQATGKAFEQMRRELATVQRELLARFDGHRVDESLCDEVNRMLKRERMSGRIVSDLKAVVRTDETDGKKYVAVVRR